MELIKLRQSKFSGIRLHIIFWIFFVCYESAVIYTITGHLSPWYDYFVYYTLNIILFYTHAYIVVKNSHPVKIWRIAALMLTEVAAYFIIKLILTLFLLSLHVNALHRMSSPVEFVRDGVWRALYFIGMGSAYAFGKVSIESAKRISAMDKQRLQDQINQQQLEKNLLTSEVAFLKAQINQHFLFNMLSFIHSNAMKYSEKLSDLIISLSDLMRYAFSEPDSDGKARLSSEIEHIENYLSLNQERFSHQLNFDFKVTGNVDNVRIISLLLVTIIENVFKYGDLQNNDYPAKVYINVNDNKLHLYVDNYKRVRPQGHSSGIGMGNVQKRLELMYPDNYELKITQDSTTYQLNLHINIPPNDLLHY